MQNFLKVHFLIGSLAALAACGSGSGSDSAVTPVAPTATIVAGAASLSDAQARFSTIDFAALEANDGFVLETNAGSIFGVERLEDREQVFGLAQFFPRNDFTAAAAPTVGNIGYFGGVEIGQVSGIGPQPDGTFADGEFVRLSGPLTLTVNFDDGNFTGDSPLDGSATVDIAGSVSASGVLTGTADFSGSDITLDLSGQAYGDPDPMGTDSSVAGAFSGSTDTEIVIGVFAADLDT